MSERKNAVSNLAGIAFRFGVIGLSTIALYFIFLNLLHPVIPGTAVLAAVCYGITIIYNYIAQSLFTFRKSPRHAGALIRYLTMHAVCMGVNSALMVMLVDGLGLALNLGQLFVTFVVAGLSFVLSYLWVYQDKNPDQDILE